MQLIDGKKIQKDILDDIKKEVATLTFQPVFCDVLVGADPASMQYVRMKNKTAEDVGMKTKNAIFPENISTKNLIKEIKKLNEIENMCGIIVQLPLPKHIDTHAVLNNIEKKLDVDTPSPAALACMMVLDSLKINLVDKKIVVLGQGELVGKPVAELLKSRELDFEIINSKTEEKEKLNLLKNADIIISGMGKGKYITSDMIKDGVVLIDAGTSESTGGMVGDVDLESVKDKASFVSPVPGGVGPVTVAMLLKNVLQVAKSLTPTYSPHP